MEQKKSILLVYYKLFKPGGVAKVLTNLANALSEQGYIVEILLLMNEREHLYPLNPNIKVHNIDTFSHWAWKICEFNVKNLRFVLTAFMANDTNFLKEKNIHYRYKK